ncbi:hypothetical protein [Streptomyces sp. NRRL B-24484]|uniref:hypothetical protein n=1 Tax=Streptomyces sp. NRRL B-24484 TaxID=1463833 RepID=UPI0004BE784A|nr:hypothetical protein [Streptomyces sp. NRRL B-24484]
MPNLPDVVRCSIPAFVLLTALEAVPCRLRPDGHGRGRAAKDTAAGRSTGRGSLLFDAGWRTPVVAACAAPYEVTPPRAATHAYAAIARNAVAADGRGHRLRRLTQGPGRRPARTESPEGTPA